MAAQEQKTPKPTRQDGGRVDGAIELPAELLDVPANIALMHQVEAGARKTTKTRCVPAIHGI